LGLTNITLYTHTRTRILPKSRAQKSYFFGCGRSWKV